MTTVPVEVCVSVEPHPHGMVEPPMAAAPERTNSLGSAHLTPFEVIEDDLNHHLTPNSRDPEEVSDWSASAGSATPLMPGAKQQVSPFDSSGDDRGVTPPRGLFIPPSNKMPGLKRHSTTTFHWRPEVGMKVWLVQLSVVKEVMGRWFCPSMRPFTAAAVAGTVVAKRGSHVNVKFVLDDTTAVFCLRKRCLTWKEDLAMAMQQEGEESDEDFYSPTAWDDKLGPKAAGRAALDSNSNTNSISGITLPSVRQSLDCTASGVDAYHTGNAANAVALFTAALANNPEHEAEILCNRSAAHLANGNPREALADAMRVMEAYAGMVQGYLRAAAACHTIGDYDRGLDIVESGVAIFPMDRDLSAVYNRIVFSQRFAPIFAPLKVAPQIMAGNNRKVLTAKLDIPKGETILRSTPVAVVRSVTEDLTRGLPRCAFCAVVVASFTILEDEQLSDPHLRRVLHRHLPRYATDPIPCRHGPGSAGSSGGVCTVVYCSEKCRECAWSEYHSVECAGLGVASLAYRATDNVIRSRFASLVDRDPSTDPRHFDAALVAARIVAQLRVKGVKSCDEACKELAAVGLHPFLKEKLAHQVTGDVDLIHSMLFKSAIAPLEGVTSTSPDTVFLTRSLFRGLFVTLVASIIRVERNPIVHAYGRAGLVPLSECTSVDGLTACIDTDMRPSEAQRKRIQVYSTMSAGVYGYVALGSISWPDLAPPAEPPQKDRPLGVVPTSAPPNTVVLLQDGANCALVSSTDITPLTTVVVASK